MIGNTKLFVKEDNRLEIKEITLFPIDLLAAPDYIYNYISVASRGVPSISVKKVILRKELNYDALYTFVEGLITTAPIVILNEESDILADIEKAWKNYNFFSSPAALYNLLTIVATIEDIDVNGPFKKAVAAYNLLFNNTDKFKSQADFSDKLLEICSNKIVEQSLNLTTDRKLQIISEKLVSENIPPKKAVLASQLQHQSYKLNDSDTVLISAPGNNYNSVSAKKCCLIIKGKRVIFSMEKGAYDSNYTLTFRTGRCIHCDTTNAPTASLEDIDELTLSMFPIRENYRKSANTAIMHCSREQIEILKHTSVVCSYSTDYTNSGILYWKLREFLYSNLEFKINSPFSVVHFVGHSNQWISLNNIYKSGNFADLCATLGLVASMLKTTEAKKEAISAKLIKIYNVTESIINEFLVANKFNRQSINVNELAVVEFLYGSTILPAIGYNLKASKISNLVNQDTKAGPDWYTSNAMYVMQHWQKTIYDKLKQESLIYPSDTQKEDFIFNSLLMDMFYMYFDLRRTSANFIKWASPTPTMAIDLLDYINNHLLGNRNNIQCINLIFRI